MEIENSQQFNENTNNGNKRNKQTKKGNQLIIVIAIVAVLAALGFVFRYEIVYAVSPKTYIALMAKNTSNELKKSSIAITSGSDNKVNLGKLLQNSFEASVSCEDSAVFQLVGNKFNTRFFNDQTSRTIGFEMALNETNLLDFLMGDQTTFITLGNKSYAVENSSFTDDFNKWVTENKESIQALSGIPVSPLEEKVEPSYDLVNQSIKNIADELVNPKDYEKIITNAFKKITNNVSTVGEKTTYSFNGGDVEVKKLSLKIPKQDSITFVEEVALELPTLKQFSNVNQDVEIDLIVYKNIVIEATLSDYEGSDIVFKFNDIDNYRNDFSVGIKSATVGDYSCDFKVKSTGNVFDVNMAMFYGDTLLGKVNFNADFDKSSDNLLITATDLGALGLPAGVVIEILGTVAFTDSYARIDLNTLRSAALPEDQNMGISIYIQNLEENITVPTDYEMFFETSMQDMMMGFFSFINPSMQLQP